MGRRRVQGIQLVALLLAVLALVLLVLRLTNVLDAAMLSSTFDATGAPTTSPGASTPTPKPTAYPTERPTITFVPQDLDVSENASPADQWAAQLFAAARPVLTDGPSAGGGFVWWQNPAENGPLAANDDGLWLGGRQLELDDIERVDLLAPSAPASNQLTSYGTIAWEGGALMLTAAGEGDGAASTRWLLSNTRPGTVVRALIQQAAGEDYRLIAAYSATFEGQGSLVLTAATPVEATVEPPTQSAEADPTLSPALTFAPTLQPTPTRAPEALMGQTISEQLAPAIEAVAAMPDDLKNGFAESHPWVGLLTWTETGPQISGRDIAIQEAQELTLYALTVEDDRAVSERVLSATYNGYFTRLPDEQLIFQDQRMDEILYWMVRTAFDEGGQFLVAYDDFGARQALTVIDLHTLNTAQ